MTCHESEALMEAKSYIIKLINATQEATKGIRGDGKLEGYQLVANIATGLEWLTQVTALLSNILVESIDISKFNEIIQEIIEGMENDDSVLVADLLEYEILEILQKWHLILEKSV